MSDTYLSTARKHYRWPIYFMVVFATLVYGMTATGIVSASLSSIGKQFSFSTQELGHVASGSNVGALITMLPVNFFAGRKTARKLRYLAIGLLVVGLGSGFFLVPAILSYANRSSETSTGGSSAREELCNQLIEHRESEESGIAKGTAHATFIFANFLMGLGSCIFYPTGSAVLSSLFPDRPTLISLWGACFAVGPALGFVVEGGFLKINLLDNPYPDWWMGFVLALMLCVLAAAFFWCLDSTIKKRAGDHQTELKSEPPTVGFKEFFVNVFELLKKPFLTLFCLSLSTEGLILAAFSALLSRVMENQLYISQSNSAMTMGLIICIGSLIGAYMGAFLFNLKKKRTLPYAMKLFILMQAIIMLIGFGFFLYCPQTSFEGVTVNQRSQKPTYSLEDLTLTCNSGCKCASQAFSPVCGSNGVTYFSPCYAGCSVQVLSKKDYAFEQCSCMAGGDQTAERGFCQSDCQVHIPFIAILALTVLILHMPIQPTITVTKNATASDNQYYLEESDDAEADAATCFQCKRPLPIAGDAEKLRIIAPPPPPSAQSCQP